MDTLQFPKESKNVGDYPSMRDNYSWFALNIFLLLMAVFLIGACVIDRIDMEMKPPPINKRAFSP